MPIHMLIENIHFDENAIENETEVNALNAFHTATVRHRRFQEGIWVKIKSGRYKGDLGIVVDDDYKRINTSTHAQLVVMPRINIHGLGQRVHLKPTKICPAKSPLPIDFGLSPLIAWASFIASGNTVTASCIEPTCSKPWECDHEEHCRKRYRLLGQTVRGGFVLLKIKLEALDVALQVTEEDFKLFTTIAEGDQLGRVPPLTSWAFRENEIVILRNSRLPAALPGMQRVEDLGILADGAEGIIQRVGELVCDVAFKEKGEVVDIRSVAYRHLVKKVVVGQTVRLASGVRDLKEIQWIQDKDTSVLSVKERRLELANMEGLVSGVFMHPLHGPSVSVWIQPLSLIVTLNPNSVVDMSYSLTLSSGNSPHPAFASKFFIPSHTTSCDIRDISVLERNHGEVSANVTQNLQCLTPEQFFAQNPYREFGRTPWLGVRVYVPSFVRQDRSGWLGEVIDVMRDPDDSANYFVLVHWNHSFFGDQYFDWLLYGNVRRTDNNGLLHEFTPYSGKSPWKGIHVKVVKLGVYKDCRGEVLDARADLVLDRKTVSGVSVQIRFHDGDLKGENRTAWVDYHYVCRCDTKPMRFLSEFGINTKRQSYYNFKLGYEPRYSPEEIKTWERAPIHVADTTTDDPSPMLPSSPFLHFESDWMDSSPLPEVPTNFWILDRRIWKTIGMQEMDVARADGSADLRLSIVHLGTGAITFQNRIARSGSRNQKYEFEKIHPSSISKTPAIAASHLDQPR